MHQRVVPATQQGEVLHRVTAAVVLLDDVVHITPTPMAVAAVELAVLVPALHGSPLRSVELGLGMGVVEYDRTTRCDQRAPRRIAEELGQHRPRCRTRQRKPSDDRIPIDITAAVAVVVEIEWSAEQRGQVEHDIDTRSSPLPGPFDIETITIENITIESIRAESEPAQLDEAIGVALLEGASRFDRVLRVGLSFQRRLQDDRSCTVELEASPAPAKQTRLHRERSPVEGLGHIVFSCDRSNPPLPGPQAVDKHRQLDPDRSGEEVGHRGSELVALDELGHLYQGIGVSHRDLAVGQMISNERVSCTEPGEPPQPIRVSISNASLGDEVALRGEVAIDDRAGTIVVLDKIGDRRSSKPLGFGQPLDSPTAGGTHSRSGTTRPSIACEHLRQGHTETILRGYDSRSRGRVPRMKNSDEGAAGGPSLGEHYGQDQLIDRILQQLASAGLDLDELTPTQLSGVDEFHLGGAMATTALLADLELADDAKVLDVGSGVGGAARQLAAGSHRHVTGIDLTPDFVALATELSARTGLDTQTSFEVGNATALACENASFDAATMFHVGMNIEDKATLFTELARVVRPGGKVAVYDIMRSGPGHITFPVPWSSSPSTSHLATPDDYVNAMRAAGLTTSEPVDRRPLVADALTSAAADPPAANLSHLMGKDWPTMFANLRQALTAGIVAPTQLIATRP